MQPAQLQTYFRRAVTAALQAHYPWRFCGDTALALSAMLTDGLFACSAEQMRQDLSRHGVAVYAYEFAEAPPGSLIKNDQSGGARLTTGREFASLFYYPFFNLTPVQAIGRGYEGLLASFAWACTASATQRRCSGQLTRRRSLRYCNCKPRAVCLA